MVLEKYEKYSMTETCNLSGCVQDTVKRKFKCSKKSFHLIKQTRHPFWYSN